MKGDWLLFNPITMHKNARWFALYAYLLGNILLIAGYLLQPSWSVYVMIAGLAVWFIPVMWCGKMFATGGKR